MEAENKQTQRLFKIGLFWSVRKKLSNLVTVSVNLLVWGMDSVSFKLSFRALWSWHFCPLQASGNPALNVYWPFRGPLGFFIFSVLFFERFYLFIHERHREREAETQAEGEAGSPQVAQCGTWSWDWDDAPEPKADAQPLSHLGVPHFQWFFFLNKILFIYSWETQREREAETQSEGEARSTQGAQRGTRSRVSRIRPWAESSAKPRSHPGCPTIFNLYGHSVKCPQPHVTDEAAKAPRGQVAVTMRGSTGLPSKPSGAPKPPPPAASQCALRQGCASLMPPSSQQISSQVWESSDFCNWNVFFYCLPWLELDSQGQSFWPQDIIKSIQKYTVYSLNGVTRGKLMILWHNKSTTKRSPQRLRHHPSIVRS